MVIIILSCIRGVEFLFDFIFVHLSVLSNLIFITMVALILDYIGIFRWCVLTLVFTAEGSRKKLFINVVILTIFVSFFLNNVATVLVLTPIIINTLHKLKFNKTEIIPYIYIYNLIPDLAGIMSVSGNPISLTIVNILNKSFDERYISIVFVVGLIALIVQTIVMLVYFRNSLKYEYLTSDIFNPDDEVIDWNGFNFGLLITFSTFIIHVIAIALNFPYFLIPPVGLIFFMVYCIKNNLFNKNILLWSIPWKKICFGFSICLIIYFFLICPTMLIYIDVIKKMNPYIASREMLFYSGIFGNVIGAKFIPIGSISTIIWFYVIRIKGIKLNWKEYIFTSATLIFPVLLLSLIVIGIII